MKKSDVNGDDVNEVFKYLKNEKKGLLGLSRIKVREAYLLNHRTSVLTSSLDTCSPPSAGNISGTLKSSSSIEKASSSTVSYPPPPQRLSILKFRSSSNDRMLR